MLDIFNDTIKCSLTWVLKYRMSNCFKLSALKLIGSKYLFLFQTINLICILAHFTLNWVFILIRKTSCFFLLLILFLKSKIRSNPVIVKGMSCKLNMF